MTVEDAAAVFAIDSQVSIEPWSEKLYVDCVGVGYECWVLAEDHVVIGFGVMSFAATEAHILNIAISPDKQRNGFGEKMLQHILNIARQHDSDEVFLEVRDSNQAARTLYEKHGFVEVGIRKGYYPEEDGGEGKEDAIMYALSLW